MKNILRESIDSILNQTYGDFEFIIVNDASTDTSEEIILSYNDERIIYIKNKINLEKSKSKNKAIKEANGKYIAIMDDDDISLPTRFEKQIEFLENNKDIGVCGTWIQTFNEKGYLHVVKRLVSDDDIKIALLNGTTMAHPTIIMRKNILNEMSPVYKEDLIAAVDYELWTRLIRITNLLIFQKFYCIIGFTQNKLTVSNRKICIAKYKAII